MQRLCPLHILCCVACLLLLQIFSDKVDSVPAALCDTDKVFPCPTLRDNLSAPFWGNLDCAPSYSFVISNCSGQPYWEALDEAFHYDDADGNHLGTPELVDLYKAGYTTYINLTWTLNETVNGSQCAGPIPSEDVDSFLPDVINLTTFANGSFQFSSYNTIFLFGCDDINLSDSATLSVESDTCREYKQQCDIEMLCVQLKPFQELALHKTLQNLSCSHFKFLTSIQTSIPVSGWSNAVIQLIYGDIKCEDCVASEGQCYFNKDTRSFEKCICGANSLSDTDCDHIDKGCTALACNTGAQIGLAVGMTFAAFVVLALCCLLKPKSLDTFLKSVQTSPKSSDPTLSLDFGKLTERPVEISYSSIVSATSNFNNVLGEGGFGVVYCGLLTGAPIAVKVVAEDTPPTVDGSQCAGPIPSEDVDSFLPDVINLTTIANGLFQFSSYNAIFLFGCDDINLSDSATLSVESDTCREYKQQCGIEMLCVQLKPFQELALHKTLQNLSCSHFKFLTSIQTSIPVSGWSNAVIQLIYGDIKCQDCVASEGQCYFNKNTRSFEKCICGANSLSDTDYDHIDKVGMTFAAFVVLALCCLLKPKSLDTFLKSVQTSPKSSDPTLSLDFEKLTERQVEISYSCIVSATSNFNNVLGEGGFGVVYCGLLTGAPIAVKVVAEVTSEHRKKHFLNEVATIGRIHHVHVVRLLGFCMEQHHRILVYEYVNNGSLDKWLFKHRDNPEQDLSWTQKHNIALGIAKGLGCLHEECRHQIVHCDIKPQNILLDENLCPKIADFGLAKLMARDESAVATIARGRVRSCCTSMEKLRLMNTLLDQPLCLYYSVWSHPCNDNITPMSGR
ncbi:hypothetical protein L7F22_025662 [Adiantum nelumboides]|nr:hypothetical protein [Adiantum nelumboides]